MEAVIWKAWQGEAIDESKDSMDHNNGCIAYGMGGPSNTYYFGDIRC